MRRRPQEPLHARGRCVCDRSGIHALPRATRKTTGQAVRPAHFAPAHMAPSCPHSRLMVTTWLTMAELRAHQNRHRRRVPRAEYRAV